MISSARSTNSNLLQMAFENGSSPSGPSAQVSPELFKQGVLEHAVWLGMDPEKDKKFLWIAERSLVAPLPQDWVQLKTAEEGHPYYYNEVTQESRWDHPSDNEYRELFKKKKEESAGKGETLSPRHGSPRPSVNTSLSMSPGSPMDTSQNLSTFSINTPPVPPHSPMSPVGGSGDTAKLQRQKERIMAERDTALELNEQLKSEIEEEMERANQLHKKCSEAEAKLDAARRQIQRMKMGTAGDDGGPDEASAELIRSLTEEVTRLKTDPKRQLPPRPEPPGAPPVSTTSHPTDLQDTLLLLDTNFEKCIEELSGDKLTDPKYGEHEVKAMVEEVEMMCHGYRKTLLMPPLTDAAAPPAERKEEGKDESREEGKVEDGGAAAGVSRETLAKLEEELTRQKRKNMSLNRRLSELEQELESLQSSMDSSKEENQAEIERLKAASAKKVSGLEARVEQLTSSLDDLANETRTKENDHPVQIAKLQAKLLEQKEKISAQERAAEETGQKLAEVEGECVEVKEKLGKKKEKLTEVSKEKKVLEAEKAALEGSIKDIDDELSLFRDKFKGASEKLRVEEAKNSEMQLDFDSEREAWNAKEGNFTSKITQIEDDLKAMSKNFELASSDLEESKADAASAWKKWDAAIASNEKLSKKMEKTEFMRDEALREVAELKARVEGLEADCKASMEEAEVMRGKYTENQKKIKKLNEQIVTLQGNIRVFCRLRPLSSKEEDELKDDPDAVDLTKAIQYLDDGKMLFHGAMYEYDHVFNPSSSQDRVFTEVQSAVSSAMEGYRVCIFAYGQTGSGKTHTMEGPRSDRGVNFRALEEMFNIAETATDCVYKFSVSVLEVYNETVCDLLTRGAAGSDLAIRMRKDEVFVENLTECDVECSDDVEELMQLASSNRSTASNNVNEHSSRSHLVLSVKVSGTNKGNGTRITGKLNLIDLAGSERLKNTSASGQRLKEAQNINKSLSALGDVVSALGNAKSAHVPYRNSKLTFLLQDSLRQSAKVLMFVNVNPAPKSAGESICSLNFAARCRAVQLGKAKKENIVVKG